MNDEERIRRALAARSAAPSPAFRRALSEALAARSRPGPLLLQRWLAVSAAVLLLALPVAVLLAARSGINRATHPTPASTARLLAPDPGADRPQRVAIASDGAVWAVMESAVAGGPLAVALSTDGGAHWQALVGLPPGAVPYLAAFDGRHAVLVWNQVLAGKFATPPTGAAVYSTLDGGRTWRSYSVAGLSDSFSFVSADEGWWLEYGGGRLTNRPLLHTSDGGRSWTHIADVGTALAVNFIDPRTGFLEDGLTDSAPPRVRRSTDGGRAWQTVSVPSPPADAGYPGLQSRFAVHLAGATLVASLTVVRGSQGVGGPESLVVYRSYDTGATWSPGSVAWSGLSARDGSPVLATDADGSWALAAGRQVLVSSYPAVRLLSSQVAAPANYQAVQLALGPAKRGVLLELGFGCQDCSPRLFLTNDGGTSWTDAAASPSAPPRIALSEDPYPGSPTSPALLVHIGSDRELRAISWDLGQSGTAGFAGTTYLPSPDGRYYLDGGQVYDRAGKRLAAYPWSEKGRTATWSTRDELCRAAGATSATGSPLILQVAPIGGSPRTVASGFGVYGDNGSNPVLACDEASDRAVVAALGQGVAPGKVWVIQLSTGRLLRTFDYSSGYTSGSIVGGDVRASADGSLLSESLRSPSGTWTTTIRRTSDAGAVEVVDGLDAHALSGDARLLAGVRDGTPVVVERGTHRVVWSSSGTHWFGVTAEPRGGRFLVATAPAPASMPYDLTVVSPDGSASLLPEGTTAAMTY